MKHQLLLLKFTLLIALWAAIPIGMRANNALFSRNAVVGRDVLCYTQSAEHQPKGVPTKQQRPCLVPREGGAHKCMSDKKRII